MYPGGRKLDWARPSKPVWCLRSSRAEGAASRVLLVVPKPLLGQWQDELYRLFDIQAVEGRFEAGGFSGAGVFLVGREVAGS